MVIVANSISPTGDCYVQILLNRSIRSANTVRIKKHFPSSRAYPPLEYKLTHSYTIYLFATIVHALGQSEIDIDLKIAPTSLKRKSRVVFADYIDNVVKGVWKTVIVLVEFVRFCLFRQCAHVCGVTVVFGIV